MADQGDGTDSIGAVTHGRPRPVVDVGPLLAKTDSCAIRGNRPFVVARSSSRTCSQSVAVSLFFTRERKRPILKESCAMISRFLSYRGGASCQCLPLSRTACATRAPSTKSCITGTPIPASRLRRQHIFPAIASPRPCFLRSEEH